MTSVLLTGGAGYIGSHTAALLAEKDKSFVILDNLSNSRISIIDRIEKTYQNACY